MRMVLITLTIFAVADLSLAQMADKKEWKSPPEMKIDVNKTYLATLDTNKGKIVLELLAKEAPKTVNSFVFLAREGFYDGTEFHRVIPGFMIQGGDRNGNPKGTGGPGYQFENENRDTKRTYKEGTVGMANSGPDTNGSQFFIMDHDYGLAPASYTIFGQLKEGQDVVHAIATTDRDSNDKPTTAVIVKKLTIEEK
jgi:peptidylprolyl isomerase/peptidyl-prolyl cis-trans isomerase B (cyclophilin B)